MNRSRPVWAAVLLSSATALVVGVVLVGMSGTTTFGYFAYQPLGDGVDPRAGSFFLDRQLGVGTLLTLGGLSGLSGAVGYWLGAPHR